MSEFIDLTGKQFGEWTVLSYAGNGRWLCRCSCGTEKLVYRTSLRSGDSRSCGGEQHNNLTGRRFGRWLVIEKAEKSRFHESQYSRRCDCGTERIVKAGRLLSGRTKSCGCAKMLDIIGQRFGKLVVVREVEPRPNKNGYKDRYFECECDCGNKVIVMGHCLTGGNTKSCGCISATRFKNLVTKHGLRHTRLYKVWLGMKARCYIKTIECYKNYGGRGITVCDEWRNDFQAFYDWAYANGYNDKAEHGKCTIDRIDVNGNYEPSNCRWVDMLVQSNNKRDSHLVTYKGETLTIRQMAEKYHINNQTLASRLKAGKTIEEAIETPVRKMKNHI